MIEATLSIAEHFSILATIVCDHSHFFDYSNCDMIVVDQGKDAVDFEILHLLEKNDIVVTQDYGLASLVLSKGGFAIHQNGMIFDDDNMLNFLNQRYDYGKLRKKTHRYGHMKKRTKADDETFEKALTKLIKQIMEVIDD